MNSTDTRGNKDGEVASVEDRSVSAGSKLSRLKGILECTDNLLISFSGGLDSSVLSGVAVDVLGPERTLAVMVNSEFLSDDERVAAVSVADEIGIRLMIRRVSVLGDDNVTSNPRDRCYHCKRRIAGVLGKTAESEGFTSIADGFNLSDRGEYRPGTRAADEAGIRHPFLEAGMYKEDIRAIAEGMGLSVAFKPSESCLATRIPYGQEITALKLGMVEKGEKKLHELGFPQVRLRTHGDIARIEVPCDRIGDILEPNIVSRITEGLKSIGYTYVTLDMEGYRSGSMDEGTRYDGKSDK